MQAVIPVRATAICPYVTIRNIAFARDDGSDSYPNYFSLQDAFFKALLRINKV